jgi:hypothetical protein
MKGVYPKLINLIIIRTFRKKWYQTKKVRYGAFDGQMDFISYSVFTSDLSIIVYDN